MLYLCLAPLPRLCPSPLAIVRPVVWMPPVATVRTRWPAPLARSTLWVLVWAATSDWPALLYCLEALWQLLGTESYTGPYPSPLHHAVLPLFDFIIRTSSCTLAHVLKHHRCVLYYICDATALLALLLLSFINTLASRRCTCGCG